MAISVFRPKEQNATVTVTFLRGVPTVTFTGPYITKRELELVIRAIKQGQKGRIREYRNKRIIANYEAEKSKRAAQLSDNIVKETSNATGTKETSPVGTSKASSQATGASSAAPAVAGNAGVDKGSGAASVSGAGVKGGTLNGSAVKG